MTASETPSSRLQSLARQLLSAGWLAEAARAGALELGDAVPVEKPRGQLRSWFLPVLAHQKLVGFFEFSPALEPLRGASFLRESGSLAECPDPADWLDPDTVQARAREAARPHEEAGAPFLSYDRVPAQLAWAVPLRDRQGRERLVYVAGRAVFPAQPAVDQTG